MPVYEFYCSQCHTIYNFYSRTINTEKTPLCPACGTDTMSRQVSVFAVTGRARENTGMDGIDLDESKMEQAMTLLAKEADHMDENDPKQAARLMRKLTDMTGMTLGDTMEEALARMERGEDPDQIDAQMGDLLEQEDPFVFQKKKGAGGPADRPKKDETLYDL